MEISIETPLKGLHTPVLRERYQNKQIFMQNESSYGPVIHRQYVPVIQPLHPDDV